MKGENSDDSKLGPGALLDRFDIEPRAARASMFWQLELSAACRRSDSADV
jgi:hypothetical protein